MLVVGVPLAAIVSYGCDQWLAASSSVGELGGRFSLPGAGPIAGLGVFVLAEIFAHGARLREDVEGTV
jgi:hypothetical protein